MSSAARATLEEIVQQLAEIEDRLSFPSGYWLGDHSEEAFKKRAATGLVSLRAALHYARWALESTDDEMIVALALVCQDLLSNGRLLLYHDERVVEPKRAQGRKSGKARRGEDKRVEFVERYHAWVADGMHYLEARRAATDLARGRGVSFPSSAPMINKWFPKPKNVK